MEGEGVRRVNREYVGVIGGAGGVKGGMIQDCGGLKGALGGLDLGKRVQRGVWVSRHR